MIFLLLPCCKSPLFKLFLIPVHFKLEFVHLFVRLEDHVLDIIQPVLEIRRGLVKLFEVICEPASLPISNLLDVFFSLNFLVLLIYHFLSIIQFVSNWFEMVQKNCKSFLMLFNFNIERMDKLNFFLDDRVQLLVLIICVLREIFIVIVIVDLIFRRWIEGRVIRIILVPWRILIGHFKFILKA